MIDLQSTKTPSSFALDAAGVIGLRYPLLIADEAGGPAQPVMGTWELSVNLPAGQRGTHMSRFIESVDQSSKKPMGLPELSDLSKNLCGVLLSQHACVKVEFVWFKEVQAPVSKQRALMDYKIVLAADSGADLPMVLTCIANVKSLCPCSKAISERGAHNQRSEVSVSLKYRAGAAPASFSAVIDAIESASSSPLYPILKREDEKFVTEYAYDHPAFVEDLARAVAENTNRLQTHTQCSVQVRNFESIHSHDCFARLSYSRD